MQIFFVLMINLYILSGSRKLWQLSKNFCFFLYFWVHITSVCEVRTLWMYWSTINKFQQWTVKTIWKLLFKKLFFIIHFRPEDAIAKYIVKNTYPLLEPNSILLQLPFYVLFISYSLSTLWSESKHSIFIYFGKLENFQIVNKRRGGSKQRKSEMNRATTLSN